LITLLVSWAKTITRVFLLPQKPYLCGFIIVSCSAVHAWSKSATYHWIWPSNSSKIQCRTVVVGHQNQTQTIKFILVQPFE
jgi:hypothetical protein